MSASASICFRFVVPAIARGRSNDRRGTIMMRPACFFRLFVAADSGLRYRGSTAAAASTSPRDTKKFGADIDSKLRSAASSQSVVSRSHQPEAASTAVTRSDATVSKTAASAISRAEAASVMSMSHRGACEEDTAGWPLLRPGSLPVASGDVEEAVAPAAAPPSMFQRLKRRLSALW